jgi:transcriptional regulator with XRE-family HTH domain
MGFKEIGRKILAAREDKGMTQVDLAQELGITQAALSNYELGKRRLYLHQIEKIALILGRKLDFFIAEEESASPASPPDEGGYSHETVTHRIARLDSGELRSLNEFLDYLEWRRHYVPDK